MMLYEDGVNWPFDAEDVTEVQAGCDEISDG